MVRRSRVLVLTLALVASILGLVPVSASAVAPGTTPDTGNFYVDPTTFEEGQSVKLTANFPSGVFMVTFYKQTAPDTWTSIGSDESNSSGNAYLSSYQVNGTQDVYARITSGGPVGRTEVQTLKPTPAGVIAPTGPDVGSLSQSPTVYAAGDSISMTANFSSGTFPITLYKEGPADTWTAVATKTSNSSGNATFSGFPVTSTSQRVFARKANNDRTEVDVIAPTPKVTLSIRRDCTDNTCGSGTATAYGELDPVQQGRVFTLQRLSGSSWVSVGSTAPTGADGKVQIQFSLSGVPQWTTRTYRLTSPADGSNPSTTSPQIKFMPGPTQLGVNVLRVDVDKGVYPTSKSSEYTGKATLSTNGNVFLDHVNLEKFGVRGTSTAGYTKKPYKLKFVTSPKDTGVFGMGADKSWTLLASYLDQTFVRDKVGLDLGRRINEDGRWTPDSRFTELFVNDQYMGSYLMTESVKIDGDRVDVGSKTGMIMEVDNALSSAIDFMSTIGKIVFAFKDPDERKTLADGSADPEGVTDAKVTAVTNRINAFEQKLYSSSGRDEYKDFIDEEAAVDFNFIKEFTKDNDADFNSSHYFSWDTKIDTTVPLNPLQDGRFHFGPAWDFDRSAGNVDPDTAGHTYMSSPTGWILRGTGTPSDSGRQLYRTHWFVQLFKDAGFNAAVKARWLDVRDEFEKVGATEVADLKTKIGVGAENDRKRWASEPKRYRSHGTYDQEIAFVTKWYKDRYNWMDGQLSN
ncbi:MAG: CotH kinase family protein [Aeromicrobium sp.]